MNFGAKRRIYFLNLLIYFLKIQPGEKNHFIFDFLMKNHKKQILFFDSSMKNHKTILYFLIYFLEIKFLKIIVYFVENRQNLKNNTGTSTLPHDSTRGITPRLSVGCGTLYRTIPSGVSCAT